MIVNEEHLTRLKDHLKLCHAHRATNAGEDLCVSDIQIDDVIATCEALWPVVRASRRWVKAMPGSASSNAEADMVQALDALKDLSND